MAGSSIDNGFIRIEDGKIAEVSQMRDGLCDNEVIDAGSALVMPGFIDAHTHLGMFEDSLGFEGDDGNEDSDPATPQLRALDAINPMDKCILLIAMAEIRYFDDIPPVVSVSEATGLARKYSTETSADFVNGVLSGVINK